MEIDHEIISTVILLPCADSFKKGCCQLQAKVCAQITGKPLVGTRDLFNISYSRELYLFSKFLHFEEIVRVKMAVCFDMIVSET